MITAEFLITSLVVVLVPGTGVVFTVSTGLVQGRRASVYAALGCTAGIVPHLMATILGLAAVMHTSAVAFQARGRVAARAGLAPARLCGGLLRPRHPAGAVRAVRLTPPVA